MSRNLDRLQSMGPNDAKTAGNLREALRIRLSILQVAGPRPGRCLPPHLPRTCASSAPNLPLTCAFTSTSLPHLT